MAANLPLELEEFQSILHAPPFNALNMEAGVAVAVSGGADSLALTKLLSLYAQQRQGFEVCALIIDHGLREEAKQEAEQTCDLLREWACVTPIVIDLNLGDVSVAIQEVARIARYEAFEVFCAENDVKYLFLGHHQDDQAETFLFRLSKGSGLDGLTCMSPVQKHSKNMFLLRPLLDIQKQRILATCENYKIKWIEDSSNRSEKFSRVRLRKAKNILEVEGLSAKRLAVTSKRLARAQQAICIMVKNAQNEMSTINEPNRIVYHLSEWIVQPEEVQIRLILQSINALSPREGYGPKLSSVEAILYDVRHQKSFRTRTLHGLKFSRDDQNEKIIIESE